MDIFVMNFQLPLSPEGNEGNLLALDFLANKMRLGKMFFQLRIIFIKSPSKFLLGAKKAFFMGLVQMGLELVIVEKVLITKFTQGVEGHQIILRVENPMVHMGLDFLGCIGRMFIEEQDLILFANLTDEFLVVP